MGGWVIDMVVNVSFTDNSNLLLELATMYGYSLNNRAEHVLILNVEFLESFHRPVFLHLVLVCNFHVSSWKDPSSLCLASIPLFAWGDLGIYPGYMYVCVTYIHKVA